MSGSNQNESSEKNTHRLGVIGFTAPSASVLVVDDSPTNLLITKGLLAPYKMRVDMRTNGPDAIAAVQENSYDIVFMDHMMPDMDGVETTEKIRALDNDYVLNLPIIALTANVIENARDMFVSHGFDDFLSKPMNIKKLDDLLKKWMPKEKQIPTVNQEQTETADAGNVELNISGIDVRQGIAMTGGFENYKQAINMFRTDTLKKLPEIRQAQKNDDLKLYAIYVHAIKSAAANIGASAISYAAKILEEASKRGDKKFVDAHSDAFLTHMEKLAAEIDAVLKENDAKKEASGGKEDIGDLKATLVKLNGAIESMNGSVMDSMVEKLYALSKTEHGPKAEKIAEQIFTGNYDEALVLINDLISLIDKKDA